MLFLNTPQKTDFLEMLNSAYLYIVFSLDTKVCPHGNPFGAFISKAACSEFLNKHNVNSC